MPVDIDWGDDGDWGDDSFLEAVNLLERGAGQQPSRHEHQHAHQPGASAIPCAVGQQQAIGQVPNPGTHAYAAKLGGEGREHGAASFCVQVRETWQPVPIASTALVDFVCKTDKLSTQHVETCCPTSKMGI